MEIINGLAITIISGITFGTIYILMSLGFTLIFGIGNIFNFAHGACFIWGAYLTWFFTTKIHLNMFFAIILALVLLFIFGFFWERFAIKPIRQDFGNVLIVGLGLMMILNSMADYLFDPRPKALPPLVTGSVNLFFLKGSLNDLINLLIILGILIFLWTFFSKTRVGLAIRAVSEDNIGSAVVGINIDKVYRLTFAIGITLAGISGILLAPKIFIHTNAGGDALVKAIIIVVFGGLGNIKGTLYGALILGIVESAVSMYFGMFWVLPFWFFILLILLTVRPRGLYGIR